MEFVRVIANGPSIKHDQKPISEFVHEERFKTHPRGPSACKSTVSKWLGPYEGVGNDSARNTEEITQSGAAAGISICVLAT